MYEVHDVCCLDYNNYNNYNNWKPALRPGALLDSSDYRKSSAETAGPKT
jgi:hypothetical protein